MAGAKSGSGGKRAGYKLATYRSSEGPRAGLVIGEEVFDAAKLSGKPAYSHACWPFSRTGRPREGVLKAAAAKAGKSRSSASLLKRTKFMAPVRYPSAIFCAGANYADHAAEMAAREGQSGAARPAYAGAEGLALPQGDADPHRPRRAGEDFRLCQADGLGDRARRRHRQGRRRTCRWPRRCPMSRAIRSATICPRATAAAGRMCPTPRRSNGTGPSTRASTVPVRWAHGSCRRAISATRRNSA